MVFNITGWVEPEPSNPFSTPTDNWTRTWFGTHTCLHDTRLLIFWSKNTILKLFLNKTDCNINMFDSRCNHFIPNSIKKKKLSSQCTFGAPVCSTNDSI